MADISINDLRNKIKEIVKGADLSTLSAKKVRIKLQSAFDADLSSRKKEIDKLTISLIMELEEAKKKDGEDEEEDEVKEESGGEEEEEVKKNGDSVTKEQNGKKKKSDPESEDEVVDKEPPKKKSKSKSSSSTSSSASKKKKKREEDDEDMDAGPLENDVVSIYDEEQKTLKMTDEELAQRLQQFEQTGRRTRNKAAPPKKKSEKRKGPTNSHYTKPCDLSPQLAEILGTDKLPRHEVNKKMWDIVKEKKLQDPKDKRFMLCDEEMMSIFGRKRVQLFTMMKYLAPHIKGEKQSLESVITNSDIYDDEAEDD